VEQTKAPGPPSAKPVEEYVRGASREELLELLAATEHVSSSKDAKFYLYRPVPVGTAFHTSEAKIRALLGANRAGKTYAAMQEIAMQFLGEAPPALEGLIPKFRLEPGRRLRLCMADYPNSFVKVIWPYVQQLVPSDSIADVLKDQGRIKAITHKNGTFIEFMQYDQDITKFAGASRHAIFNDEEAPQDVCEENRMRLIDTDGEEVHSLTPLNGATPYLYDTIHLKRGREVEYDWDFVMDDNGRLADAVAQGLRDVSIPGGDPLIDVFYACIFDNPAIKKEAAIRILRNFPNEEMLVRGKGHILFRGGLVYKEYSDHLHLIDNFTDWFEGPNARNYTLYVAIDPHPRTPHAVLFVVIDREGTMFVVDEIYSYCTVNDLAKQIKERCRGKRPEVILIDPSASTPDPASKSCFLYDCIDAGLNDPMPYPAARDKDHGILTNRRLLAPDAHNKVHFFVTANCTRFRFEIARYAWDNWRKNTEAAKGEKQRPVDKDDHMMENWYRLALQHPGFIEPVTDEEEDYARRPRRKTGRSMVTGY
jgi:hypothetical protein